MCSSQLLAVRAAVHMHAPAVVEVSHNSRNYAGMHNADHAIGNPHCNIGI